MADLINHPDHYGGEENPFEVIKVLRAWNLEYARGFCWGNVIKYVARAGKKSTAEAADDYRKANWYAKEAASIEAELATKPRKADSEIPLIISGHGNYKLEINWETRKTNLVKVAGGGAGGGDTEKDTVVSSGSGIGSHGGVSWGGGAGGSSASGGNPGGGDAYPKGGSQYYGGGMNG